MSTKLTLSINEQTIEKAKLVSRKRGTSLSKIVEDYLNTIVEKEETDELPSERIKSIMQPYLSKITIPEDGDYRKQVREWKFEEYLKGGKI